MSSLWFAAFSFGLGMLFTIHGSVAWRALVLYLLIPSGSGAVAGFFWGAALLDVTQTKSLSMALVRAIGIAAGAFVVFSLLFVLTLPVIEPGWSASQVPSLFFAVLTLGLLAVGRLVLLGAIVAAVILYWLARRAALTRTHNHASPV